MKDLAIFAVLTAAYWVPLVAYTLADASEPVHYATVYEIVQGSEIATLEIAVTARIANGWKPQGGMVCHGNLFCQAMTK